VGRYTEAGPAVPGAGWPELPFRPGDGRAWANHVL